MNMERMEKFSNMKLESWLFGKKLVKSWLKKSFWKKSKIDISALYSDLYNENRNWIKSIQKGLEKPSYALHVNGLRRVKKIADTSSI